MSNATPTPLSDRVELLESDIRTLTKLIITHRRPLGEGDIRAASNILRRWITDGMIGQLCNEAGVELAFPVLENAQVWAALPNTPEVNYFLSGGVKFKGSPFMGFYNSTMPAAQGPTLPIDQFSESFLPFGKFKREKRIWFEGEAFSREEIILFVANKLGGVHYDGRRDLRQEKLERASRFMTFGGPIDHEPPGQVHLAVEPKATEILSGLHVEIISAAASFINLHIDGAPLVSFTVKRTIFESIARLLKPKPGIKLIDRA